MGMDDTYAYPCCGTEGRGGGATNAYSIDTGATTRTRRTLTKLA